MVQRNDSASSDIAVTHIAGVQRPPTDSKRKYSETVNVNQVEKLPEVIRYYRSTYDFSAPKRYKTVLHLEPRLAPVRYHRTINFCISPLFRHKSMVECDYRHRPRAFSETAWVFPKNPREIITSTVEYQQLVDTKWYKAQVDIDEDVRSVAETEADSVFDQPIRKWDSVSESSSSTSSISDEELTEMQFSKQSPLLNNNYEEFKKPYANGSRSGEGNYEIECEY